MIILISYYFKVTDFYVSTTYISVLLTLASENYLTHFYEWTIGNETPHYGRSLTLGEKKLTLGYLRTSFLSRVFHQIVGFSKKSSQIKDCFAVLTLTASSRNHNNDDGNEKT